MFSGGIEREQWHEMSEVQVSLITNFLREKLGEGVRFGSVFKLTEINILENVFKGFPKHV